MDVGGFSVQEFSDESLAYYVEEQEFFSSVVDVFHHHAVFLRGFTRVDELPEFSNGWGKGDFHEGVGASLHAIAGDGNVGGPVRADDDSVRFALLHHVEVGFRSLCVLPGSFAGFLPDMVGGMVDEILVKVAYGDNVRSFDGT